MSPKKCVPGEGANGHDVDGHGADRGLHPQAEGAHRQACQAEQHARVVP